jgi:4-amino-4-deoxy-L-arabinose transferase-like glycosyltransferase
MNGLQQYHDRIYGAIVILFLFSLLLNLGVQPIYLEEPRRAMIAMEMVENGNYIVPTQMGEYYYKKPPVFNWLLIASAKVFGDFTPWALRLPTVLSVVLAGVLLFWLGRRYVNREFAQYLALLFPICGAIYFYFSPIGEIDLFYTLLTMACFFSIFHFQQQRQYFLLFVLAYFFAAVGLLTKGLPSVLFLGLTLVSWLWYEGEWKKLFSFAHITGIALFVLIVGGYAYLYHQYNPIEHYWAALFAESVQRTAAENSVLRLFKHLVNFPIDTIKDSLPGALFLLFLIRKDWKQLLRSNPLVTFAVIAFVVNFLVYWISPGARQRYIYMLYPFILIVGLYAYQHRAGERQWQDKVLHYVLLTAVALAMMASISINFIPAFDFLNDRLLISIVSVLAFAGAGYFYLTTRQPLLSLLLIMVLARLFFDMTVLPQRTDVSEGQVNKATADEIYKIVGDEEMYVYENTRFSFTIVYYLNRYRGRTLHRNYELKPDTYFIMPDAVLPQAEPLVEFDFHDARFKLIKTDKDISPY